MQSIKSVKSRPHCLFMQSESLNSIVSRNSVQFCAVFTNNFTEMMVGCALYLVTQFKCVELKGWIEIRKST